LLRDSFGRAPILQQDLTTTGITLVDELDLADAVGSEMPKALAYLAPRWYNFARINSAVRMSPAMACGLEQRLWDIGDIVKLIEDWESVDGQ
jgi:hypothetical protein